MTANKKILLLPGDGIGPEVCGEVEKIADWLASNRAVRFEIARGLAGGAAIDAHGTSLTDETLADAMAADAVLLGAVGGPKWDQVDFAIRPEAALLRLRKQMDLFANLRPAIVFPALADASTLKREVVEGLDIMIVRELTGGVYFGEPRGIFDLPDGQRKGVNTQVYTTAEIRRIAEIAFDLARKRNGLVHSVEKMNVMESGRLWREEVTALHGEAGQGVRLEHMLADNCAMQLVKNPKQFDVIVTDNLFGDMLSDEAAMLTGSLGMLPSASLGPTDQTGHRRAMYEPVHGSAPDIAGQGLANPLATILSFAMMLRYSFDLGAEADLLERAVARVLDRGVRTGDLAAADGTAITRVGTSGMGDAVIEDLAALAA